jgi:hypothetical protein
MRDTQSKEKERRASAGLVVFYAVRPNKGAKADIFVQHRQDIDKKETI